MAVEFWVVVQNDGGFGNCPLTVKGNKHLTVFLPNVRGNQTAILGVQQFLNSLDIQGRVQRRQQLRSSIW
jgi:hypothetical protein